MRTQPPIHMVPDPETEAYATRHGKPNLSYNCKIL